MYIHIGDNIAIQDKNIIGIFDLETSTVSNDTQNVINKAQKDGFLIDDSDDIPKSFILCGDMIYISEVSSATLRKRG